MIGRLDVGGALETVGIYAHYDGQPVNASAWDSDPWAATLRTASLESGGSEIPLPDTGTTIDDEWRLYARAAADDKAPIMAILAAFDALKTKDITPARNIVFLFEGEEEAGSPHLRDYLQKYAHDLAADAWLLCDGPVHQSRRPQLVFGVRGITSLELTVYGANRALHSGHYGNWAPNPAMELAQLLASMKDAQGRVTVEGFYDSVTPIGDAERRALDAMPTVDELLKQELGLNRTEGGGIRLEERLLLPSLNIRGLESATVGSTARNIVPASATADIDIRLVQGNDPAHMLDRVEHHIRTLGWHIVRDEPDDTTRRAHKKIARVVRHEGYRAARTGLDDPRLKQIILDAGAAAQTITGKPIVLTPTLGGSLPVYLFEDELHAPFLIVPIANHDDNQHAPNENLRLGNLRYGIALMSALMAPDQ